MNVLELFTGGVATDSSGNVYVVDTGNGRILKFNSTGSFITKWGTFGFGDGLFNGPVRVAGSIQDLIKNHNLCENERIR